MSDRRFRLLIDLPRDTLEVPTMTRPIIYSAILLVAALLTGLASAALAADDNRRPTVDPTDLLPAAEDSEPAAVFGPPPTIAERWRTGLQEIIERRDAALAALKLQIASAPPAERLALEKQLQAVKLDHEIAVLELQLALEAENGAAADPARVTARERVAAAAEAARTLRASLGVDSSVAAKPAEAEGIVDGEGK